MPASSVLSTTAFLSYNVEASKTAGNSFAKLFPPSVHIPALTVPPADANIHLEPAAQKSPVRQMSLLTQI